ncbi:MAG: divalent-cation tolerance protein CutA [Candidatus Omnitrophica bacterium]|nr:divalent-cation tolerance protein CutA [Candidatus Omnitrophota bacterium]
MNIVVLVTASNKEEAQIIARKLLEDKLAACVNIIEGVNSFFWWEGKIDNAQEALMVIKSSKGKFKRLCAAVKSAHSYDTPEIIALPVVAGEKKYLDWLNGSIR